VAVAKTVQQYNALFCSIYAVNQQDTKDGVPGVLYGRYKADAYGSNGGGNPWALISASLASLFYQAAQTAAKKALSADELLAWRQALGSSGFKGDTNAFVAAGDSVLLRLVHHIKVCVLCSLSCVCVFVTCLVVVVRNIKVPGNDDLHVYEQIDRATGDQYNAKDLTWSYAEILGAMRERDTALAAGRRWR
jgi:hypothetical protein